MEIKSKEIVIVPVASIVPNPKNANKHSNEQIKRLSEIVDFQGFRVPLIVSKRSGFLMSGHGRLEVAKAKGMTELPVIYQDFDSEAQEYAFLVSDNEISRWAELDLDSVKNEMIEFPDLEIELLGLKEFTMIDSIDLEDSFDKPEPEKKFILEITFPNDCEMADIRDDLLSRGYLVREK